MTIEAQKWEYHIEIIQQDEGLQYREIESKLNELGSEGWECFEMKSGRAFKDENWKETKNYDEYWYYDFYCKRPIRVDVQEAAE